MASAAFALPQVLILRLRKGAEAPPLADLGVEDAVAGELQASGKVIPIVWNLTDPVFRDAANAGKISPQAYPSMEEVGPVADKLRCEYVLIVEILPSNGAILASAKLLRKGSETWKDPETDMSATLARFKELVKKKKMKQSDYDEAVLKSQHRVMSVQIGSKVGMRDTAQSLARTWSQLLVTGPLKSLAAQPFNPTPTPDPGQNPTPPNPDPVLPKVDNSQLLKGVADALRTGQGALAVNLLRDGIDASPFNVERRLVLVRTLLDCGQPEIAAQEARRAADLVPDRIELRTMAARAWLQAGDQNEAQADLNEAVARDPEGYETRLLLAEVALAKNDPRTALEHLNKAVTVSKSGDPYFLRSMADALLGRQEQADADMKKANEAGLSSEASLVAERYNLVCGLFDSGITALGNDIRSVQQRAQVQRGDSEVKALQASFSLQVGGRAKFLAQVAPPANHKQSHDRRVLAYKLLSQSLIDLGSFLKTGSEDELTDSRINLGEALKQCASARDEFRKEQQGKSSNGKPG